MYMCLYCLFRGNPIRQNLWHAFFVQSQTLFLTILVQASSVIRLSQQSIHFSDPFHINSHRNYRKILPLRAREGKKLVLSRSQYFKSNIHKYCVVQRIIARLKNWLWSCILSIKVYVKIEFWYTISSLNIIRNTTSWILHSNKHSQFNYSNFYQLNTFFDLKESK